MGWVVVGVQTNYEPKVIDELGDLGLVTYSPMYQVEHFHPRKSIIVTRSRYLFPGYFFLQHNPIVLIDLMSIKHRAKVHPLAGCVLKDEVITDLQKQVGGGLFDIILHKSANNNSNVLFIPGTRVKVLLLNLIGTVHRNLGRFAEIMIDGFHLPMKVSRQNLTLVEADRA